MYVKVAGQTTREVRAANEVVRRTQPVGHRRRRRRALIVAIVVGGAELRQAAVRQLGQGVLGVLRRGRRPEHRCRRCRSRASRWAEVKSIELDGPRVLVTFNVDKDIRLGDRTEAAIKTKSLLGAKILEVTPRGGGQLDGPIPVERTTSPYQLPDALGDLADHDQRTEHRPVVGFAGGAGGDILQDTPPDLKDRGRGRRAVLETLEQARRRNCANCWPTRNKATTVLAERSDQVVRLIARHQRAAGATANAERRTGPDLRQHLGVSRQLQGVHRREPRTAEARAGQAQRRAGDRRQPQGARPKAIKLLNAYAMSLGESLSRARSSRPTSPTCLPGQFLQPFIDAAFSDLGSGSQRAAALGATDPQIGQPGTPALPVPYPRTGQGGEPRLTSARCHHRQPRRSALPVPRTACPRRRPAARRRDRPRCRHPIGIRRPSRLRRRSSCPHPARRRRPAAGAGPDERRDRRIGLAIALVLVLCAGLLVAVAQPAADQPYDVVGILREQQRHLRRRRGADPRRARRRDRQRSSRSPAGQDHVLVRRQVQGARRRQGGDPVAAAGDRAGHPTHPRLHRRTRDGRRRGHPRGPHRGAGGVGRVPRQLESSPKRCKPTEPGGVSTLGAFVNTAADNLRGQGANIRDTIIKLSQAFSALGDHSTDIFATVKNLSILVSALQDSTDLMRQLNHEPGLGDRAAGQRPDEVGNAVEDLNAVVGDVQTFVADNRETLGTTSDKLASVSRRWSTASTTSSRHCTSPRTRCRTSSTSISPPRAR